MSIENFKLASGLSEYKLPSLKDKLKELEITPLGAKVEVKQPRKKSVIKKLIGKKL